MHSPHLSWAPILFPLEYNFVSFSHGDTLVSSLIREMLKKNINLGQTPSCIKQKSFFSDTQVSLKPVGIRPSVRRDLQPFENSPHTIEKYVKRTKMSDNLRQSQTSPKDSKLHKIQIQKKKQEKGEKCVGGLDAHTPSEWAGAGLVALCKLRSVNLSIRLQDCHQLELYLSRLRNIFLQID